MKKYWDAEARQAQSGNVGDWHDNRGGLRGERMPINFYVGNLFGEHGSVAPQALENGFFDTVLGTDGCATKT